MPAILSATTATAGNLPPSSSITDAIEIRSISPEIMKFREELTIDNIKTTSQTTLRSSVTSASSEPRSPRLLPVIPPLLPPSRPTFVALQEWEGVVLSINAEEFVAPVVDLTDRSKPDDEITFATGDVSEDDRSLMGEGALFRWTIGLQRLPGGNHRAASGRAAAQASLAGHALLTGRDAGVSLVPLRADLRGCRRGRGLSRYLDHDRRLQLDQPGDHLHWLHR